MEFDAGESPVSLDERDPFIVTGEAKSWAEKYFAADGDNLGANCDLIRHVESDKVNHERLETELRRLSSTIDVKEGFCVKCRHLLRHWPDLSTSQSIVSFDFGSVSELEAAARARCKFCASIFSRLGYTKQLDTFRKIEQRLAVFWHDVSTVLNIQGWGPRPVGQLGTHLIWLTLPGRRAYPSRYASGLAVVFVFCVEDPSGKIFLLMCQKCWPVWALIGQISELVARKIQCIRDCEKMAEAMR